MPPSAEKKAAAERDAEQARLERERAEQERRTEQQQELADQDQASEQDQAAERGGARIHMPQPDEPRRGQDRNARRTGDQEKVEPGLPDAVRAEDRDQEGYDREMSGRRRGHRGHRDPEREEHDRERERDSHLPLEERRPEFLTEEERTEQVEHIHRQYPQGYSPTAGLGERE